jgi:Trypsin-like peptidase domain
MAVPNGTATPYHVSEILYHPKVHRRFDVGLYAPSMNPKDGEVGLPTTDLAIMRLAQGGPALPHECELATDEELARLARDAVGHMGFPGTKGKMWPARFGPARATLATGSITRLVCYSDYRNEDDSAPPSRRRWVRSTASLGRGASGGPLFLENGHVIALYFGASATAEGVSFEEFVRIEHLRGPPDLPAVIHAYANLYLGIALKKKDVIRRNIAFVDELIDGMYASHFKHSKAPLFIVREYCRELLGDRVGAREDFQESIRQDPEEPCWYHDRADFWERHQRPDLAACDRAAVMKRRGPAQGSIAEHTP